MGMIDASEYYRVKEENKRLRREIDDLSANLRALNESAVVAIQHRDAARQAYEEDFVNHYKALRAEYGGISPVPAITWDAITGEPKIGE